MVTASAICLPMGMVGFRAVSGSWNTMENSVPRSFRISRSEQRVMSRPSARMVPETMEARLGSSFITLLHRMLLPHPDSPTSASTSPGATAKDTSRHRLDGAGGGGDVDGEVFHFQQIVSFHSVPPLTENQVDAGAPTGCGCLLSYSNVQSRTFQKMPTPWCPSTVSGVMPFKLLSAT